ncbi:hypothetical protein T01_11056 [Trichinella spiralis]|uniref:Uncharacterized protein n=1 Tax=Trichinella spiralis TaxID=6334 RepID=A0A0V1BI45_TRISP|nr:hypothetical protein T01_11056 [Trichinella spiralis]
MFTPGQCRSRPFRDPTGAGRAADPCLVRGFVQHTLPWRLHLMQAHLRFLQASCFKAECVSMISFYSNIITGARPATEEELSAATAAAVAAAYAAVPATAIAASTAIAGAIVTTFITLGCTQLMPVN